MMKSYVLITAAHNEEKKIEYTIDSILKQTILPSLWIIVSDRSSDNTDNIIRSYSRQYNFIKYIGISGAPVHSFGGKVNAINTGIEYINSLKPSYSYIGVIDADISFEINYFEKIIDEFTNSKKLGLAGGNIIQFHDGKFIKRIKSLNSVAGAVQLFRRECFEKTVGFIPREFGGEDSLLEINARMNGWDVRTFEDIAVIHHGMVGDNSGLGVQRRFRRGICYYTLGYHPLFHLIRSLYRINEKPFIIGSISEIYGFCYAAKKKFQIDVPMEIVYFLRKEQKERLRDLIKFKLKVIKN